MPSGRMTDALAHLQRRFDYAPDGRWPSWRIMPDDDGVMTGNCNDYALTLAYQCAGGSILRLILDLVLLRSLIWICITDDGELHAALRHRGYWADNIAPVWAKRCAHRRIMPAIPPVVFIAWAFSIPQVIKRRFA